MTPVHVGPWEPMGRALLDYHRGRRNGRLEIRSDLWEDERVPVADYYRPAEASLPEIERRALARCRGRVLDGGAGAGRHALELARRGLEDAGELLFVDRLGLIGADAVSGPDQGLEVHSLLLFNGGHDTYFPIIFPAA